MKLKENSEGFVFTAELPGAKPENIKLNLTENNLSIAAKIVAQKLQQNGPFVQSYTSQSTISRSFDFSATPIDVEHSEATFKNGVLTVKLVKKKQSKFLGKKIPLNA